MATIHDVAARAGVAVSTVSKVLKNYPNVSKATKDAVMNAVNELDYTPNLIASTLSSKNTRRVGLIIFINNNRQAIDEINMQYLFGAFDQASEESIEIIPMFSSVFKGMSKNDLLRYLRSQSINGLIFYGLSKENQDWIEIIHEQQFAVVCVDAPLRNQRTSSVMINHCQGQYDVAKATIATADKCEKVLYIAGGREGWVTEYRLDGIMTLRDELGFDLEIEYCDFSERSAYETVLRKGKDFDVICCASDIMAIGAVTALKELDVFHLVTGYDGITLLGYIPYAINTVHQDFYLLSKTALHEMSSLLAGERGKEISVDYEIKNITYEEVIQ